MTKTNKNGKNGIYAVPNEMGDSSPPKADWNGNYVLKILFVVFVIFAIIRPVFAANSALQLSPFLIEQDLHRGQNFSQDITVTNAGESPKFLTLSLNDFLPAGTDGETQILPVDRTAPSQTSLARWIIIDQQPKYNLEPGESTQVKFTIHVPVDAEAGAHYGALLFTLDDQIVLPGQSLVRQQVATLVIVDIDRSFERGNISSFGLADVGGRTSNLQFLMTFHNSGLNSLKPKGEIAIKNIFGREVANAYINRDANTVLPATDRIFASKAQGNFWGRYTAVATVTFGSNKLQSRATAVFWIFPPVVTILWGVLYLIVIVVVITLSVRRYNAWLRSKIKISSGK